MKQWVLSQFGDQAEELAPFARRLIDVVEGKFNRHLYDGRLVGYGAVLFPRTQK